MTKRTLSWIIGTHLIIRLVFAISTNLGIDEVYYFTYSLYPAWSYFDHPPMVGWLVWLTTVSVNFTDEFFVRLGPLISGSLNLVLIYFLGTSVGGKKVGLLATIMTASSIYAAIIAGVFILPDSPQSTFWILALYLFVKYIQTDKNNFILLFGAATGFALLSKYHAVFLWFGVLVYLIFNDRKKLTSVHLWVSGILSLLIFAPVIIWNLTSDISGFSYHVDRVGNDSLLPTYRFILPEIFGQIFYNNPVNVIMVIGSLILVKKKGASIKPELKFLLFASLPLVITVVLMSLFNRTLPHWSGPSYFGLFVMAASVYVTHNEKKSVRLIRWSAGFFAFLFMVAMPHIHFGFLNFGNNQSPEKWGKNNGAMDLVIWDKAGKQLERYFANKPKSVLITHNWFPGAHIDHYYALKNDVKLYVIGDYKHQHQYMDINRHRGELPLDSDVYYITTSMYNKPPSEKIIGLFKEVDDREAIPVILDSGFKMNLFVWQMKGSKTVLPATL